VTNHIGENEMKQLDYALNATYLDAVEGEREQQLDWIEEAIQIQRNRIMVKRLRAAGVECYSETHHGDIHLCWNYIYVTIPGQRIPATIAECKRLLDTIRNLPVDIALERWATKVEPVEAEEYTEDMARRDTREARAQLRRDVAAGDISADAYADLYRTTSFMDLAQV